jgi:bifunctional UDP-N-acetylglucosamine pyrophosphorylase/glucosamine-1-phosphate N-acetyltransferase
MTDRLTTAVVLAAGLGMRMKSDLPKVLHSLAGRPLINHVVDALESLKPDRIVVVVGPGQEAVAAAVAPYPTVVQANRLGTAHAVLAARQYLENTSGDVLILFGDSPMVRAETLRGMLSVRARLDDPAIVVSGFQAAEPGAYGRLMTNHDGRLEGIIEAREANPEQLAINLCNGGFMAVDAKRLLSLLDRVRNNNAKGEYYLTDIVALACQDGENCAVFEAPEAEFLGINARAQLAAVESLVQAELRTRAMAEGATLTDPNTVFFSHDTRLGRDVTVGPYVVFGPGVTIGDNVDILPFCHIEEATVAAGARIGPYTRLRPGAKIGSDANIGNFVEIKNSVIEAGAKANHLSYIGDARVGAGANIGAGTITCNYDGYFKHHTDIGKNAFIGSNTSLVAPVVIGDGALIGAGSVIAEDVPEDALALTRAPQQEMKGWATTFHQRKAAEKAEVKKKKD